MSTNNAPRKDQHGVSSVGVPDPLAESVGVSTLCYLHSRHARIWGYSMCVLEPQKVTVLGLNSNGANLPAVHAKARAYPQCLYSISVESCRIALFTHHT